MRTITLPNIRSSSDLTVNVRLKDSGVAIDWSTLFRIKAFIYSDAQRAVAGRCDVSVDGEDPTLLVCEYSASKPQYLGANRIIISATYMGETKTYDKPCLNFVRWTDDVAGQEITISDPDVDVEIEVEDVSSSILDEAIRAAIAAAEDAIDAAARADAAAAVSEADHLVAVADHTLAGEDHTTASADHTQAGEDHTRAGEDHTAAAADHTQAGEDHTRAGEDHTTAAADHTQAGEDHTTAAADHSQAGTDHSTASEDHTQALADHAVMEGYDTRLGDVEKALPRKDNVMLQILDADPADLAVIPYGVIDFSINDYYEAPSQLYLVQCCYRSTNGNFIMRIKDANGDDVINRQTDISNAHGLVQVNLGRFHYVIDADWAKSKSVDGMNLGTSAPIDMQKASKTTGSRILRNSDSISSKTGYHLMTSNPGVKNKEGDITNFILSEGACCKFKMNNKNTYAPAGDSDVVTFNIASTGAYPLFYNGKPVTAENTWEDNEVVDIWFNGSAYYAVKLTQPGPFDGTDGSASGKQGMVPAPLPGQRGFVLSADGGWVRNDGCFVNEDVPVDANSQRTKNYEISPGSKIVIKVTKVAGTGSTYNAYWIKAGGNEAIFTGKDYGYISDVLTVPDDATGVSVYMAGAAVGNIKHVKIYDATMPEYLAETVPTLDERVTAIEPRVETLEGKAVDFTGTNGSGAGTAGLVPAPAATNVNKFLASDGTWKSPEYFVKQNVNVNTNSQRTKTFNLIPGSKIAVRVTKVAGTSATYNLLWTKAGGNETVFSGYPLGYMSDVLTVPDDATGVSIFMTPAASGNVNNVEIWNAEGSGYLAEKIGSFGINYLKDRKILSKTVTLEAGVGIEVFSLQECCLFPISGDIYAYIETSAKLADDANIRFWTTDDISSGSGAVYALGMRQNKLFKVFSDKTLGKVVIAGADIVEGGTMTMALFAVEPSAERHDFPLWGMKIMCFGDSITQFKSGIDNKRYSDHLQDMSQAVVSNAGIGGTRIAQRTTPSLTPTDNQQCVAAFEICSLVTAWATNEYSLQDAAIASGLLTEDQQPLYESKLAMLKANPIGDFDIVTIMGGGNDYRGGSVIGTPSQASVDKGTIYGAVNAMVSSLLTAKPTLRIYFFSPTVMMFSSTISLETSSDVYIPQDAPDGKTFPEFIESIKDAVKKNHCPYCDLYWTLPFNVYNWTEYYSSDYSHPYRGFQLIAQKFYKYLLSV